MTNDLTAAAAARAAEQRDRFAAMVNAKFAAIREKCDA